MRQGLETFQGYVSSINKDYLMLPQKEKYTVWCSWEKVLGVGSKIKLVIARKQIFH